MERKDGDDWFIDASELQGAKLKQKSNRPASIYSKGKNDHQKVVVTDIKIPFWSMVTLMVKFVIAAIPALLILFVLWVLFLLTEPVMYGTIGGLLGGVGN